MRILSYQISDNEDGRLIARIIRGPMGLSRRQFSVLKARDCLYLDGEAVHANAKVRPGQLVTLRLEDEARDASLAEPEEGPILVVYEDEDYLVIDKEAPLPCQSSSRQPGGTLENRLAYRYGSDAFVFRPVNRLDKGTSGLMLVAKNAHAQTLAAEQLHTESFDREYLAVAEGALSPAEGVIDLPIRKADGPSIKREVDPAGKPARTFYRTLSAHGSLSLVRLRLDTGRTHQIRVHLSALGCPVYGDFLYGQEKEDLPGRFALHSAYLSFLHPLRGERLSFESPLPEALRHLLEKSG